MDIRQASANGWGVSWVAAEPAFMQRASHALAADGAVWLIDPVDGTGLDEMIAPLGSVRGVLQLLDRHPRDGDAVARRHGVTVMRVPFGEVPGSPFSVLRVVNLPGWREVALWWPQHRALVVPEALGTAPYYLAPGRTVGIHPMLRMFPPTSLDGLAPVHLLPGHGEPASGDGVAEAIHDALGHSRRDIPRVLGSMIRDRRSRKAGARE